MAQARIIRKQAYLAKTQAEFAYLREQGLISSGHAFASVLFLKGELSQDEQGGGDLLSGKDGAALRSALTSLGYAPEDWACLCTRNVQGEEIPKDLFRQAITSFDPATLVCLDEPSAQAVRDVYYQELSELADFDAAMLVPGHMAQLLGMRVLALGGFAAALEDDAAKQKMWARLKMIPPLGEPF